MDVGNLISGSSAFSKSSLEHLKVHSSRTIEAWLTAWQIEGEAVETVTDFLFLDSKIIADGDHSHEIRKRLIILIAS